MSKQLIIEKKDDKVAIAFLEDKRLLEYHIEKESGFKVGNFYLGNIKKLLPGMNAAFVDVGYERDGFLHYTDLSPHIHSILNFTRQLVSQPQVKCDFTAFKLSDENIKKGRIEDVLKGKPQLLVQVLKEPIDNKGPRLSCEFVLTGRHIVLRPFGSGISISKKITDDKERQRLKNIALAIKGNNFGMIIRTAARHKTDKDIISDYQELIERWQTVQQRMSGARAPQQILQEVGKSITLVRDLLNQDFTVIAVNDVAIKLSLQHYLTRVSPEKVNILQSYSDKYPIMNKFGVTKQIKMLFAKNILLPSGAYLFIEKTEALHVIDVNSGNRVQAANQEENALQTNLEATQEIARQLRLRDIGGIIIIDFIDMKLPDNKRQVYETMFKLMKTDRAKHTILPLSKFNIMQITRQRIRPEVSLDLTKQCFICQGTGRATPIINMEGDILKMLPHYLQRSSGKLTIRLHPFAYAYFKQGWFHKGLKWSWQFRRWIHFVKDNTMGLNTFAILDNKGKRLA